MSLIIIIQHFGKKRRIGWIKMDWSHMDYLWIIVMFLSAVWTPILMAPIHCKGSISEQVMLNFSKPVYRKM